jgi:hypothetical protein
MGANLPLFVGFFSSRPFLLQFLGRKCIQTRFGKHTHPESFLKGCSKVEDRIFSKKCTKAAKIFDNQTFTKIVIRL